MISEVEIRYLLSNLIRIDHQQSTEAADIYLHEYNLKAPSRKTLVSFNRDRRKEKC